MIKGRMPLLACGPFLLALSLSSCREPDTPSAEENRQLDNAAEMLDAAPDALSNIDENTLEESDSNALNTDGSER
ncbi:hypothetical protein LZ519_05675 [Sphingomonas sp. RG327]|jgi:hypothetical protein|uniref:Secreted protein n=1 Tax=Sphingomonas anseongensis TaxID=2908207 RepID=A0ABT0REW7_9SPHN|nr:hypothetical protein [Sphingomonas anseongensis]MCL6678806.1 hypothetical protein [Sphingomonas anseongensis]